MSRADFPMLNMMKSNSANCSLVAAGWGLHLAGLAVVFASACGWWQLTTRLRREGRALEQEHQETSEFLKRAGEVRRKQAEVTRQVVQAGRINEAALARVPKFALESEFLRDVSQAAAEAGLTLRDYRPGRVAELDRCSTMELQLRAEGTYDSLCRFVAALPNLPRVCKVAQFSVTGPGEARGLCGLDLQLELVFAPRLELQEPNRE